MRRVNTLLKLVGVALCVAPILSVAHAQQSASQANLLLEVQQLRLEIAELRDMVERQQFQLRKLQRNQSQAATQSPSGAPMTRQVPVDQSGYMPLGEPGAEANEALPSSANQDQPFDTAYQRDAAGGEYSSTSSQAEGGNEPASSLDDGEFAAPSYSTDTSPYPPVVDRSIGGSAAQRPSQGAVSQPVPAQQTGEPRWQGSPNTQGSTDSPRPNVYQQTQPNPVYQPPRSSQPLPSATAQTGGGVIAIPQESDNRESEYGRDYRPVDTNSNNQADAPISSVMSESDYYSQGFNLMKQSKFDEAVAVFEKQLEAYPNGDSADDAHYWIAEAMYVSRNLEVAKRHLHTLIQDYPQSRRVPDAMLKKAYIEQQLGNKIEARILFQEIVNFFPKSDAAIAAKNRLADSN